MRLQKLLADFVFRDRRLESHPKIFATHVRVVSRASTLDLVAEVSKRPLPFGSRSLDPRESLTGHAFDKREAIIVNSLSPDSGTPLLELNSSQVKSMLLVPILGGAEALGVISLISTDEDFFGERDIGRVQLLAALIALIQSRPQKTNTNTEAAAKVGRALAGIRTELGLTQDELAYRGGFNRIALSQWERGRWPPSLGPIYKWCSALGLVAEEDSPQVSFLDVTPQLLVLLRDNPEELRNLSPERFEHVVAERIDRMGYDVQLTGRTNRRDGGIDLIAVPKLRTIGSFLMAAQIKHHHSDRTTGRPDVDRLLAWKDSPFRIGLMVTNTGFSQDARWLADQVTNRAFLRLRDFEDLKRWLCGQFDSEFDWRELPDVISLAPGITVEVPKARLRNSRDIWPLTGIKMVDKQTT
jgi:transcriptional regulator with XRE-family HTH domain